MKLDFNTNPEQTLLTVAISGSIDTVTAPQLERELAEQRGEITHLVLDFAQVDYISSAGLRVIMFLDQQLADNGSLVLKNVNSDVKEVFEMTGFDQLFNFE